MRRIFWRVYFFFSLAAAITLILSVIVSGRIFERFILEQTTSELKDSLIALERVLRIEESYERAETIAETIRDFGMRLGIRFTVVSPDGTILADSMEDPSRMANHGDRPEIRDAFGGIVGVASRYSPTLKSEQLYVAIRVQTNNETRFVLRASRTLASLEETMRPFVSDLLFAAILILAGILGASAVVARSFSAPIVSLQREAERVAGGDLLRRLPESDIEEFSRLAHSLNTMAEARERQITELTVQKNELEAILASLDEALVLVDNREQVLRINAAAGKLFHTDPAEAAGKPLVGVLVNKALYEFARQVITTGTATEREIDLYDSEGNLLYARGVPVTGCSLDCLCILLVFSDITHLKKLENIRKEFVANVSHELRTPITSIKGYIETLRDGAINDPVAARNFLDIIARQSDRLGAIIEDLLALSKIERDAEHGEIVKTLSPIKPILVAATQPFAERAAKRNITIEILCDETLSVPINAPLIEQAVGNLLDNAVKYSNENGRITVEARSDGTKVVINVTDTGIGIAAEHLSRLFERFYRVDKARSRAAGGTGLGLAIVKHIVLAHGGAVSVKSEMGKGSTFSLHLPLS